MSKHIRWENAGNVDRQKKRAAGFVHYETLDPNKEGPLPFVRRKLIEIEPGLWAEEPAPDPFPLLRVGIGVFVGCLVLLLGWM